MVAVAFKLADARQCSVPGKLWPVEEEHGQHSFTSESLIVSCNMPMVNVMMSSLFFRDLQLTFLINWPVLFNPHLVLSKAYLWRVRFYYIIPALCETHITWCQRPRPRITPLTRSNDIAHQIDRSLIALPTSTDKAALEGMQPKINKKIWFALKALPWSESTWQQNASQKLSEATLVNYWNARLFGCLHSSTWTWWWPRGENSGTVWTFRWREILGQFEQA